MRIKASFHGLSSRAVLCALLFAIALMAPSSAFARDILTGGGPVESEPHVYAIFWGANWNEEPGAA